MAGALVLGLCACTTFLPGRDPTVFRAPDVGSAEERYSAWFADERDGIVYFGLSPFWTALWESGEPGADLRVPGPHLIGRFELASESFLRPLELAAAADDVRSSVWDVLAHPNGWVYFTTFFEDMGRVNPSTGAVEYFPAVGRGLNELALGPHGRVYVTRYGSGIEPAAGASQDGAVVMISETGEKLAEVALHALPGSVTAVKSVAADARSGSVIVNADVLTPGNGVAFARFRLDAELGRVEGPEFEPELLFATFTPGGRGYLVEDDDGRLRLLIRDGSMERAVLLLGPRVPHDFAQDIHVADDGTAAIAFWSGRVELVRERDGVFEHASVTLEKPDDCAPPDHRSLVYSAFAERGFVYATLFCGVTILRAPVPEAWSRIGEKPD